MKKKKILLVVGILIGLFCVVCVSLDFRQVTYVQKEENTLFVGCFKIEFMNQNPIQIGKAYPIEDRVGKTLTPYEFSITNTCNELATYQINLEVLNESTMNEYSYIKAMLDEENPKALSNNKVVKKTLENAITAYKLKKSFLNAHETKNFTLRLWLDESTPSNEEIMNPIFKSKVTIMTSYIDEILNKTVIAAIKELSKTSEEIIEDDTIDKNLRFIGLNPSNYVSFGDVYETNIYDLYDSEDNMYFGLNLTSMEECESFKIAPNILEGFIIQEKIICKKTHSKGDKIL